ncbi:MAG TPA: gamma-glutamyl-gamma-aminobutyrate hydrolase family protein [Anaerolineaceae bacterium]
MAAPLIGITTGIRKDDDGFERLVLGHTYVDSIVRAGGIPVMVPANMPRELFPELMERVDALLFTGGPDIDPALFGGKPHARVYGVDERRDTLELELVRMAVAEKKPFLGICRGIQVINVALGGTLYTDLEAFSPSGEKHDFHPGHPYDYKAHPVTVSEDSRLHSIVNAGAVRVNSLHHQAIETVAPSLVPVGYSHDRLVEAVELPGHPFALGVQWHPEWLPEEPQMRAIFSALVRAAQQ